MSSSQCCSSTEEQSIEQIRKLYTELAHRLERDFGWGKGKDNARCLGYDPTWLERLPDDVWSSAAAVGNPFSLGPIRQGETVVDLGCGAGADLCIAALLVGDAGRAYGVDITPAMVERSRRNAALIGVGHVEVFETDMAQIPLEDGCADVVIANGSLNLSPRKACVLREVYRILRSGGRFQFADMVQDVSARDAGKTYGGSWADCVSGTLVPGDLFGMLSKAGFLRVELVGFTGYRTAPTTIGALIRATK